jgi:hypothetical protein
MIGTHAERVRQLAAIKKRDDYVRGGMYPERVMPHWPTYLALMRAQGLEPLGIGGTFVDIERKSGMSRDRSYPHRFQRTIPNGAY